MDRISALSTFKAVVEQGAFSRAAEVLDISCAKVTRGIQELEELFGTRLLNRTSRGLSLTNVGLEVLEKATEVLSAYDELAELGRKRSSDLSGTVKLSAPGPYARRFLMPSLAKFSQANERVSVDLKLRDGREARQLDDVDLSVVIGSISRGAVVSRMLGSVSHGLFASPEYIERTVPLSEPGDLSRHNCLVSEEGVDDSRWHLVSAEHGSALVCAVKGTLRSGDSAVLVTAALLGIGIVRAPQFMVEDELAAGALVPLLTRWEAGCSDVNLVYESRKHQPAAVRSLIEHLAAAS